MSNTQELEDKIREELCDWNRPSKMDSIDLEDNVKKVARLIDSAKREARIDELKRISKNCTSWTNPDGTNPEYDVTEVYINNRISEVRNNE